MSGDKPEKAKRLFEKTEYSTPYKTRTESYEGYAKFTLDQMTLWKSAACRPLDDLRFVRLDRAATDHEIAMEVLAAEQADRQDILDAYVESRCDSDTPAVVARGLMVAGFSDFRNVPARNLAAPGIGTRK